jgi:DNA ligase-1
MFKNLNAPYKPGSRVGYMVKLKTTLETLDLVIVGAEWGEGKRSGWLTSYILACRDEDTGELLTVGKMSTGLKEKSEEGTTYEEMTKLLKPLKIREEGKEVEIMPQIVIEVSYEEIQKSPNYTSGFALRFPRFVRLRDDKSVDEIDTLSRIEKLYLTQRHRGS